MSDERAAAEQTDLVRLHRFSTIVAVSWGLFAFVHLVAGRHLLALIHLAAWALATLGVLLARRAPQGVSLSLVAVSSCLALVAVVVLAGGARTPTIVYLALFPLVTGLFRRPLVRRTWLAIGLLSIVAIPPLTSYFGTAVVQPGPFEQIFTVVALALVLYAFGSEWRASSDALVTLLEARRRTIEAQAEEVQRAHDVAVKASENKSRFVAMTSHELRGPLNGILGMSHALADTRLTDNQRELVRALSTSAESLSRLLSDLLDIARIEAGRVEVVLKETDVRGLVADVVDTFATEADAKGLDIVAIADLAVPAVVPADAGRVGQVLRNLVSNAVKFTDKGSVTVEITREDSMLWISVEDTGRGMKNEDVGRIFQPFEQVSSELVDRRAGTGLGLWIARSFVESWGGTIVVDSSPGEGTEFRVSIPLGVEEVNPRFTTLMGMPVVVVITQRPATARAFLAVGREIEARVVHSTSADEILAAGRLDARAVVIDTTEGGLDRAEALAPLRLKSRLVLAATASQLAEAEKLAAKLEARVMLLPPRATRLLTALETPHRALTRRPSYHTPSTVDATLLVVDDDGINRRVARHAAQQLGLRVLEAPSGEKALEVLGRLTVDLVLLDLHLEGMDGDEVARRICSRPEAPAIIAYTGSVQEADRRRLLEAGVTEILGKPLDRGSFLGAVNRAMDTRRQQSRKTGRSLKLDVLDSGALDELTKIMGEEVPEMIVEFLPQLRARVAKIVEAAIEGELGRVGAESHSLASTAATFGALRVAIIARTLEAAAHKQDLGRARPLSSALAEAAEESVPLLEAEARARASDPRASSHV
ncbi:MAG: response regulator [Myxococcales bacterium]|nr:response regulator [Myxococcales bacterium]